MSRSLTAGVPDCPPSGGAALCSSRDYGKLFPHGEGLPTTLSESSDHEGKGLSIFYVAYLSVTSRMHGQRTVTALRKALRLHAEGMVKPRSIVFPGKGCRQLH